MTNDPQPTTNKKKAKLILNRDAAVLREIAKTVDLKDIGSKKIGDLLSIMKKGLHAEEDGVAIAAPQVGSSLRIFMVSGEALRLAKKYKGVDANEELNDLVFINPEIMKTSKKKKKMEEGCLSVRWLYGKVSRHEKVTITTYNEEGEKLTVGASGLLAQIFQHEIDHLNGILFTDKAEDVKDMPPERNKE
ncbi:MAG: peptide deformylase [bacterium]|nr:peptide deformylase [bacterium]